MSRWSATVKARLGGFLLDVDLESQDASTVALIGANGSGKTTFLRAVAGAVIPEVAEITVQDTVLSSTQAGLHVPMEHRRMGYLPQGYGLFTHLSVLDNVAFGLCTGRRRQGRAQRHRQARRVLQDLGCEALAERRIGGLSGGEQQRVALARALVVEPQLLLLDEPLAALDATTRRKVRAMLAARLANIPCPTIMVTHDVRDVAALDAHVVVFEQGRVVQSGALQTLQSAPATEFVAEFVGPH